MSGISKKYFNLDTKELREKKEREEKKIFRNKEAKLSSNYLNSFFNLFVKLAALKYYYAHYY